MEEGININYAFGRMNDDRNINRSIIDSILKNIQNNNVTYAHFFHKPVDISNSNSTNLDLRKLSMNELRLINFSYNVMEHPLLDKASFEVLKQYILKNILVLRMPDFSDQDLSSYIYREENIGVLCLKYINFSDMDMSGANFHNACLRKVVFNNTNIAGANFTGAREMKSIQFSKSINYMDAIFSNNSEKDSKFKSLITKYRDK